MCFGRKVADISFAMASVCVLFKKVLPFCWPCLKRPCLKMCDLNHVAVKTVSSPFLKLVKIDVAMGRKESFFSTAFSSILAKLRIISFIVLNDDNHSQSGLRTK